VTSPAPRLAAALADRYRIERELGQAGVTRGLSVRYQARIARERP